MDNGDSADPREDHALEHVQALGLGGLGPVLQRQRLKGHGLKGRGVGLALLGSVKLPGLYRVDALLDQPPGLGGLVSGLRQCEGPTVTPGLRLFWDLAAGAGA